MKELLVLALGLTLSLSFVATVSEFHHWRGKKHNCEGSRPFKEGTVYRPVQKVGMVKHA